jgi:hypothetical protein
MEPETGDLSVAQEPEPVSPSNRSRVHKLSPTNRSHNVQYQAEPHTFSVLIGCDQCWSFRSISRPKRVLKATARTGSYRCPVIVLAIPVARHRSKAGETRQRLATGIDKQVELAQRWVHAYCRIARG